MTSVFLGEFLQFLYQWKQERILNNLQFTYLVLYAFLICFLLPQFYIFCPCDEQTYVLIG